MVIIRAMQQPDVDEVMAIEVAVCDFPWTASIYSDCIKVGYSCWVLEENKVIVGYGLLSMAANEAHILNLVIKPSHQGQGLGRKMMEHLLAECQKLKANSVYLEVRLSNHRAYNLYRSMGFVEIGVRKDYYPAKGGRENALVLELSFVPKSNFI